MIKPNKINHIEDVVSNARWYFAFKDTGKENILGIYMRLAYEMGKRDQVIEQMEKDK